MSESVLTNIGVLVTRPADQAEPFCQLLNENGAQAIRFPALEIVDLQDAKPLLAQIQRLQEFDIAVFISPNAVNKSINLIHAHGTWPEHLQVAAIGRKSAQELKRHGHPASIYPNKTFNSEALLAMPELADLSGKRIIIFRGGGGRELLGDTFKQRGAQIEYANAYRRAKPQADSSQVMYHWSRGEIHIVAVTSTEILRNLFDLVGKLGQMWLRKTPLLLGSERLQDTAKELGFKSTLVLADDPSDESMLKALTEWAMTLKTES